MSSSVGDTGFYIGKQHLLPVKIKLYKPLMGVRVGLSLQKLKGRSRLLNISVVGEFCAFVLEHISSVFFRSKVNGLHSSKSQFLLVAKRPSKVVWFRHVTRHDTLSKDNPTGKDYLGEIHLSSP